MNAIPLSAVTSVSRHPQLFPCSLEPSDRPRHLRITQVSAVRKEAGDDGRRDIFNRKRSDGRMVDEGMIVLRKRIHEMKMAERNYEPPAEWMGWEKKYYTSYQSMIYDLVGVLQSHLIDIRPSLVLVAIALLAISVPTTSALAVFHCIGITKAFLSGMIHVT